MGVNINYLLSYLLNLIKEKINYKRFYKNFTKLKNGIEKLKECDTMKTT